MSRLLNYDDFRTAARRRLPQFLFEYIDRGAEDEQAIARNHAIFQSTTLTPRVLIDVEARSPSVQLFGRRISMPVAIAPTAAAAMISYQGEHALARSAARANIPFCLSGASSLPVEEAVDLGGPVWFQAYTLADRNVLMEVIARVAAAGADALVITVDTPVLPIREYNVRNGFSNPIELRPANVLDALMHPGWLSGVILRYILFSGGLPRFENLLSDRNVSIANKPGSMAMTSAFDWGALDDIRKAWPRTLIIKGIMHPEDATLAIEHGADGIVVSNHGGRNLDSAPSTLETLPAINAAVGGRIPILLDGGIRRGSDVLKAVDRGAHAVLCGKLMLYGCASRGEDGVSAVLNMLRKEIETTMAFTGRISL